MSEPVAAKQPGPTSAFAPFRQSVFAVIWAATVLGNTGSFMRDVASSWLVTDLSASPAAVSMIQAAATLPIFLFAIPAGVLSDILDRRRFLIGIQLLLAAVSATLMVLSHSGLLTVSLLIGLTFVGGIGAAMAGPSWQAIVPELVPKRDLKSAVALNSLGINIARSIGPAAGGILLAAFGAAVAYSADIFSDLVVMCALLWWPRAPAAKDVLSEKFFGAFRAGLRYTRSSRELHLILFRAAIFFAFASAVWALLPLVAKNLLGGDASFYGVLLGAVGAGAIGGALTLPRLRARFDSDNLLLMSAIVTALVMAVLALAPPKPLAIAALLLLGAAWIAALTTFSGAAQAVLPNWVRGRGLAVYLMVFNGAMAAGSLGWGALASVLGVPATLLASGCGLVMVALLLHRIKLPAGEVDLTPSNHWPEPLTSEPVEHDRGPVLILVEYRVARGDRSKFFACLTRLSDARRRNGAYGWGITEDAADPEKIVEWFMVESWAEHLRQHHRVSNADADVQRETVQFHVGQEGPVVRHFLTLDLQNPGQMPEPLHEH
ncbi:MFS transporter [Rhodopseudomonas sp. P2A-2r]|uniref:MFS transporter n=1 Tax=Rhodopseudomonas sp. P2A-2r TaxID=2991972 RepID=UPI0022345EF5|nr:MFS transporter [Rhodopseudomonas sp. P2A-2r]UZE49836.1 MFS transporter [Rhodopseudomonas sp. P2A-2r]